MDEAKTNIAYVTSCYPRASDSFIQNEVRHLRNLGFNVSTFSVRKPGPEQIVSKETKEEFLNTYYLLLHPFSLFFSFFAVLFLHPVRFFKAFSLAFKTSAPGIKSHIWQFAYFIEACLLSRALKMRKITHLHNHIAEASATVAMLTSALSEIPFSQTVHGPGIFYHPEKWALREKIGRSSFTRCISLFCKSQCMVFSEPSHWDKLHVIHCGLDSSFLPSSLARIPPEPKLLTIGRMDVLKGHLLLLEAAERLSNKKIDFKLVIVGDGPLRGRIKQEIKEKKLEGHVELLGWLSASKIKEQIINSRAVVSTSLNEGLPVVLMEALALGRPVISPCISGIPELVVNELNGYLFLPGSVDGAADAMEKVIAADVKMLEEMGERGSKKVNNEFNMAIEGKKLALLIKGKP